MWSTLGWYGRQCKKLEDSGRSTFQNFPKVSRACYCLGMDTVWSPRKLRGALHNAGMEVADLAATTGIGVWALYKYGNLRSPVTPPPEVAKLIARALGVDVTDLKSPLSTPAADRQGEVA